MANHPTHAYAHTKANSGAAIPTCVCGWVGRAHYDHAEGEPVVGGYSAWCAEYGAKREWRDHLQAATSYLIR